jgi:hypothetical protein
MNAKPLRKSVLYSLLAVICLTVIVSGCGSGPVGKYQDANKLVTVELQAGGKAVVSMGPISGQGTWTISGNQITITVQGDSQVFTLASDGSITSTNGGLGKLVKVN